MRRRRMCQQLRSGSAALKAHPLWGWWTRACSSTSSSTIFTHRSVRAGGRTIRSTHRRQAGCMAKAEKRRKTARLPKQVTAAIAAADEKQARDLVVLDLSQAAGFTDYFVICSDTTP